MPWDPVQYLAYSNYRVRPALDLINRVPLESPTLIVDLGCGVGDITRQLRFHWPEARIVGLDSSAEKLERAEQADQSIEWRLADIEDWSPRTPIDLLFSNSTLHWLDRHEILFPKLLSWVAPNGVFAVQMCRNFMAPSHSSIYRTAREGPWSERLEKLIRDEPCKSPEFYWELLSAELRSLDIWETTYLQVMEGENPVADFLQQSWLSKFLEALDIEEQFAFDEACRQRIKSAYPERADGKTLYPYRRLFMVAQKGD